MAQANYIISTTALSTTASGTTVASGSTQSATFVLARTMIRSSIPAGTFDSGSQTWTVHSVVSAMATPYEMYFVLERRNSGGTVQSTSSAGTTHNATGTFDDNITWNAGTWAANDQLVLLWYHRRPSGSGNKSGTVNANGASYVNAPTPATTTTTSTSTSTTSTSTTTTTTTIACTTLVTGVPNGSGIPIGYGNFALSQSILAAEGQIRTVTISARLFGNPTSGILHCYLYECLNEESTTYPSRYSLLGEANNTVSYSQLTSSFANYAFTFNPLVCVGNAYSIVITITDYSGCNASNNIAVEGPSVKNYTGITNILNYSNGPYWALSYPNTYMQADVCTIYGNCGSFPDCPTTTTTSTSSTTTTTTTVTPFKMRISII